jgi:hypothetical protein
MGGGLVEIIGYFPFLLRLSLHENHFSRLQALSSSGLILLLQITARCSDLQRFAEFLKTIGVLLCLA